MIVEWRHGTRPEARAPAEPPALLPAEPLPPLMHERTVLSHTRVVTSGPNSGPKMTPRA
jgi:hypothetical protein